MSSFLAFFAPLGLGSAKGGRCDGDLIDKANHKYTPLMLFVFTIVVSTKQYVGDPIQCWCPAEFKSGYESYTNTICWVTNTYYTPFTDRIPDPEVSRVKIGYYQWVPIILLFQILMFFGPRILWQLLANKSGLDLNNIFEAAKALHDGENREKKMRYLVRHLDRYFGSMRGKKRTPIDNVKKCLTQSCLVFCGRKFGNYLIVLYLIVKSLTLANAIGQLFILNAFLGSNYHLYGIDVIHGFFGQMEEWSGSERFPRVTLCDFKIRNLGGNIHRHTVQCVLPINLFNEKIFIFIWFWLVFISIATGLNLLVWFGRVLFKNEQLKYIRSHVKAMEKVQDNDDKKHIHRFTLKYLRYDGVFVFRIMGMHTNDLTTADVVSEMWQYYKLNPPVWERNSPEADDA